jgi:DNA polymerase
MKTSDAIPYLPEEHTLPVLREAVQSCKGCDLYKHATQAVLGEGARKAKVMFVGEQPGDQEDLAGKPFVGPAGRILDKAMKEAGIDRHSAYLTNAVKHFKWEERGKRRIHKKPSAREVAACRPWLEAEIEIVRPSILVALGSTAVQSLAGSELKVMRDRGRFFPHPLAGALFMTIHPSALLRIPDDGERHSAYRQFVDELRLVAERLRR